MPRPTCNPKSRTSDITKWTLGKTIEVTKELGLHRMLEASALEICVAVDLRFHGDGFARGMEADFYGPNSTTAPLTTQM